GVLLGRGEAALGGLAVVGVADVEGAADLEAAGAGGADGVGDGVLHLALDEDAAPPVVVLQAGVALVGLDGDDHLHHGVAVGPDLLRAGLDVPLLFELGGLGDAAADGGAGGGELGGGGAAASHEEAVRVHADASPSMR